jgi:hypothetical protein
MDDCHFVPFAAQNMTINTVVTSVQVSPTEPLSKRFITIVQNFSVHFGPVDHLGSQFAPEFLWLF